MEEVKKRFYPNLESYDNNLTQVVDAILKQKTNENLFPISAHDHFRSLLSTWQGANTKGGVAKRRLEEMARRQEQEREKRRRDIQMTDRKLDDEDDEEEDEDEEKQSLLGSDSRPSDVRASKSLNNRFLAWKERLMQARERRRRRQEEGGGRRRKGFAQCCHLCSCCVITSACSLLNAYLCPGLVYISSLVSSVEGFLLARVADEMTIPIIDAWAAGEEAEEQV